MKRRHRCALSRSSNTLLPLSSKKLNSSYLTFAKQNINQHHNVLGKSQLKFDNFIQDYALFKNQRQFVPSKNDDDAQNELIMQEWGMDPAQISNHVKPTHHHSRLLHRDPTFSSQMRAFETAIAHNHRLFEPKSRLNQIDRSHRFNFRSNSFNQENELRPDHSKIVSHLLNVFLTKNANTLFSKLDSGKKGYLNKIDIDKLINVCGFDYLNSNAKQSVYDKLSFKCTCVYIIMRCYVYLMICTR